MVRTDRLFVLAVALAAGGCGPEEAPVGQDFGAAIEKKKDFFQHESLFYVRIEGWDPARMDPGDFATEQKTNGARVKIFRVDPDDPHHCPDAGAELLYQGTDFDIRTSGNLTNGTPKSSYKIKLGKSERFLKMRTLNLKSMWNDVSQMREALAWELFDEADVPAPRHSYARFCINDRYYGLYSVIEQVDDELIEDHFGDLDKGNLYKAYWVNEDLGPADLAYRVDDGDDSGSQYRKNEELEPRTYEIKSNEDEPELNTYDDLATLIRVLHKKTMPAGGDFNSPAFEAAIEKVIDVRAFLRWASVNILLGAWDNYYGTPANYYLYNSGREEGGDFVKEPFFTFIPWDYDNSLGSDFFGTLWHKTSIVNWSKHTRTPSRALPLVTHLLANDKYLAYYLDHMECMLQSYFNTEWVEAQIGDEERGLWALIRQSVYLESDSAQGQSHTGRQFTNDQVYWNGFEHHELKKGSHFLLGIWHHVKARHDNALSQIKSVRQQRGLTPAADPVCN